MPSPLGHALAGAAIGLLAESPPFFPGQRSANAAGTSAPRFRPWLLPAVAAAVAVSPDLDLVFEHFSIHLHRSASHSVAATLLIFIVVMAVTGKVTGEIEVGERSKGKDRRLDGRGQRGEGRDQRSEGGGGFRWRWAAALAAAHLSHVFMDWLGQDPSAPHGLQALWPVSREFYVSGLDLFPSTDRRLRTSPTAWQTNIWAIFIESVVMVPIAALALWRNRRA